MEPLLLYTEDNSLNRLLRQRSLYSSSALGLVRYSLAKMLSGFIRLKADKMRDLSSREDVVIFRCFFYFPCTEIAHI